MPVPPRAPEPGASELPGAPEPVLTIIDGIPGGTPPMDPCGGPIGVCCVAIELGAILR